MRQFTGVLAVFGLVLGAAGEANALTVSGSSSSVIYEGLVDYTTTTPGGSFPNLESTIISKAFSSITGELLTATYANPEADFTSNQAGFRWSERILNNTGQAWSGFTVQLVAASGFFSTAVEFGENAPYRSTILNCCPPGLGTLDVNELSLGTSVTLNSPTQPTQVSFSFATTPVPHMGILEIYIPMEGLPLDSNFFLMETPTAAAAAVPEPGSLFLIAVGLTGLGVFGRKRLFKGAAV
jgi:hypothetical protein